MNPELRPAPRVEPMRDDPSDVAACRAIDAGAPASSAWDVGEERLRDVTRVWVAREGDALVGYLLAWHVADEISILNVAVAPEARRRGAGRALVACVLAYARSNAARVVLLEVRRSNAAAIALYRSTGFCDFGVRRGYYADTGEDALELAVFFDAPGAPHTDPFAPARR